MDEVDRAERLEEVLLNAAISNIRKKTEVPVNTTGKCWTCGDPVQDQRRWCDADCRDAYGLLD